jgi:hypothetical protein
MAHYTGKPVEQATLLLIFPPSETSWLSRYENNNI